MCQLHTAAINFPNNRIEENRILCNTVQSRVFKGIVGLWNYKSEEKKVLLEVFCSALKQKTKTDHHLTTTHFGSGEVLGKVTVQSETIRQ